jgi:hypothetical protein
MCIFVCDSKNGWMALSTLIFCKRNSNLSELKYEAIISFSLIAYLVGSLFTFSNYIKAPGFGLALGAVWVLNQRFGKNINVVDHYFRRSLRS